MTLLAASKEETVSQAINIGTGVSTSINDLILAIAQNVNTNSPIKQTYVDYDKIRPREIEVFTRTADISKAKRLLQYEPRIQLKEGIRELIRLE